MRDPEQDEELPHRFDLSEDEVTVEFVPEGAEAEDDEEDEESETWQWDGERWTKVSG